MSSLRILITNKSFAIRGGAELYVRDLVEALLARGHSPLVYTTDPGEVSVEIRALSVPVIEDLNLLATPPDIIHGQDHVQTITALLHFPGVPAVFFCHGWTAWEAAAPHFPRLLRYVAVDHLCRDRMIFEHGIPEDRIQVIFNFVDLLRFKARDPLPRYPRRALIFSNYANENNSVRAIREACSRAGIEVDVIGSSAGNTCTEPESLLREYDLVFARGRSALEALAVGAAVVLCGAERAGPMVTTGEFEWLRPLNFGFRALRDPVNADFLERQIARYDAEDAAKVSRMVRAGAGRDEAVNRIVSLYRDVVAENAVRGQPDVNEESRAAAAYLRWLAPTFKTVYAIENRASLAESALEQLRTELGQLRASLVERDQALQALPALSKEEQDRLVQQLAANEEVIAQLSLKARAMESQVEEACRNVAEKENQVERITNSLGWRLLSRYGRIKYGVLLPAYKSIVGPFKAESHDKNDQGEVSPATNKDQDNTRSELTSTHQENQLTAQPSIMTEVFSNIYHRRAWGEDCESVSGPGSSVARTSVFRDAISALLKELNVRTLLDAGCGDFNWMKLVNLDLERYIGVDVVSELISENQRQYRNATRTFLNLDISKDKLPRADLILSRDCLVHFSFKDGSATIKNFRESGSTYLLTTTFPCFDKNADIDTGGWRHLNFQAAPFNFPEPLKLIEENQTNAGGVDVLKYLGLWALRDIAPPGDLDN